MLPLDALKLALRVITTADKDFDTFVQVLSLYMSWV